jgi:hypothetical protein
MDYDVLSPFAEKRLPVLDAIRSLSDLGFKLGFQMGADEDDASIAAFGLLGSQLDFGSIIS